MTATLTALLQVTNAPPRVQLTLSGAAGSTATIYRVTADGTQTPVRTANPAPLVAGAWAGYDYEAPFGVEVSYLAGSASSSVVNLAPDVPWLVHPGIPDLSVPLAVASRGARTRATGRGVHLPLGRKYPVVISDGVRKAATFDLTVRTATLEDEDALEALLDCDAVMLLQIGYTDVRRALYEWVSVDATTASAGRTFASEFTLWTLPCTITDSPVGMLQSQWTWADVAANYASWAQVTATFTTWRGLLLNTPGA